MVQVQVYGRLDQLHGHDDVLTCSITCDGLLGVFALPTRLVLHDGLASCMSRIGVAEREETLDAPPQKKSRSTGTAQRGEAVDVNVEEKTGGQCEVSVRET
jgi:hypothetical protein